MIGKVARLALALVAGTLVAFIIVEGVSSGGLLLAQLYEVVQTQPPALAERLHTEYDQELGWVNGPSLYIPDMYGPGISLRTNGQRFRASRDYDTVPPAGRVRLVCSGDSFTLGYGVDDDHTWCERIAALAHQFEPINMGQAGYGLDQAYLWYKRDGAGLSPHVHVVAFITDDFRRMQTDDFLGNGKPVLRIRDGALVTEGVPVPRPGLRARLAKEGGPLLRNLRAFQLMQKFIQPVRPQEPADLRAVASKIFESLRDLDSAQGTTLVLAFLPLEKDYDQEDSTDWRRFVKAEASRLDIRYVDLIASLRQLPRTDARSLFIHDPPVNYRGAAGHYSVRGNEFVVRQLYEELMTIPTVAAKLQAMP